MPGLRLWPVGSVNKFPDRGLNPGTLHWEHAGLATGEAPGKSLCFFKNYLKRKKGKRKPVLKRYLTLNEEPGVDKSTVGSLRVCRMESAFYITGVFVRQTQTWTSHVAITSIYASFQGDLGFYYPTSSSSHYLSFWRLWLECSPSVFV